MKILKFFVIFSIMMLLPFNTIKLYSDDFDSYEVKKYLDDIDLRLLKEEPEKAPILCFDVNSDGYVAVGLETYKKTEYILVYNEKNEFIYAYSFYNSGTYSLKWENKNLWINIVRGNFAVCCNENNKISKILGITTNFDANKKFENNQKTKKVNDVVYKLGVFDLVKIENGKETIIYKSFNANVIDIVMVIFGFVAIFIGGRFVLKARAKQLKKEWS